MNGRWRNFVELELQSKKREGWQEDAHRVRHGGRARLVLVKFV